VKRSLGHAFFRLPTRLSVRIDSRLGVGSLVEIGVRNLRLFPSRHSLGFFDPIMPNRTKFPTVPPAVGPRSPLVTTFASRRHSAPSGTVPRRELILLAPSLIRSGAQGVIPPWAPARPSEKSDLLLRRSRFSSAMTSLSAADGLAVRRLAVARGVGSLARTQTDRKVGAIGRVDKSVRENNNRAV
jgi:hypothetical protein